ncbi:hypothetical protein FQN57_002852 [Myotisia sp. PD_48]|nr:hypothetical protein FQN57_002852 [Myotisia sp. PD_48]
MACSALNKNGSKLGISSANGTDLTFYPPHCNKVSPTFFTWVKIGAVDVHRLKQRRVDGRNQFFFKNHPIQFICLGGIIMYREEQPRRTILVLDDSSGATIEIVCSKKIPSAEQQQQQPSSSLLTTAATTLSSANTGLLPDSNLKLQAVHVASTTQSILDISPLMHGVRVKLKGTITTFRSMRQLHLERYQVIPDLNAEVQFWEEKTRFMVDVLNLPWRLTDEEVRKLKAEWLMAEEKKKQRKAWREKERARRDRRLAQKKVEDEKLIERRYLSDEETRERFAEECREASRKFQKKIQRRKERRKDETILRKI